MNHTETKLFLFLFLCLCPYPSVQAFNSCSTSRMALAITLRFAVITGQDASLSSTGQHAVPPVSLAAYTPALQARHEAARAQRLARRAAATLATNVARPVATAVARHAALSATATLQNCCLYLPPTEACSADAATPGGVWRCRCGTWRQFLLLHSHICSSALDGLFDTRSSSLLLPPAACLPTTAPAPLIAARLLCFSSPSKPRPLSSQSTTLTNPLPTPPQPPRV